VRIKIQGGWFQDEPFHAYFGDDGQFIPSITQVLKLTGISDYSGVDPAVLDAAAERGTKVHHLAAAFNRYGEVDPNWIEVEPELNGYFNAYMSFLSDSGFRPDPEWTEVPMIACVHGFRVGITPDCHGILRRDNCIIELKTTAARMPGWTIQTAIQECAIYKSNHCGRVRRFALMLMRDGKYRLGDEHTDHDNDMADGIAALRVVWRRIRDGQKVWEKVQS